MQDGLFSQVSSPKDKSKKQPKLGFESVQKLFDKYQIKEKPGYISKEFQDFGYRLAVELGDLDRVSLYMRMAKKEERGLLERALSFVSDANARSKARLFMWKVKQLKDEKKAKKDE